MIDEPTITQVGDTYRFLWEAGNESIFWIIISKVVEGRHGEFSAEFSLEHEFSDKPPITGIRFNLTSQQARNTIVKRLTDTKLFNLDWHLVIDKVCAEVIQRYRTGEPALEIWPDESDTLSAEYLLQPLLYRNHPTVLFGDYSSLKSLTALAIAYIVQLPYYDNDLGLITIDKPTPALFLDYEDDPLSFRKRWSAIEKGIGKGHMPIQYLRMTAPLADSIDRLKPIIIQHHIGLVIVDSLGPAARGNLNDPEPAIKYHAGLRQLNVTSLTLAHTSKDQLTKKHTIFGSVFFTNLARSVWECKAEQEPGEDEAIISLKHTKANLSKLHPAIGYGFSFTNSSISISSVDLKETALSGELPLSWQIKNLLRRGSFSLNDIAEQLNNSVGTTGRTLRRMRSKNQVIKKEDDTWGLPFL